MSSEASGPASSELEDCPGDSTIVNTANDIAIRVTNLSKCYQIYDSPRDRLKQFVVPKFQQLTRQQSKQYFREFWALQNVSFEVKKGKTIGIIGRNGSGKSTLLQIICGTLTPTCGTVETNGRIAALLELGAGFNFEFTGRENVYMNGALLGLSKQEIDIRFDEIAAFADIGQFIEQPVKTYSSGMIVRLAFAVAVNVEPQILIVDEALSVGDELFQRKCFSRIETIKNSGATILFVSHSASMINQLCDEAILLDHGNLLQQATPRSVTKYYHQLIFAKADQENDVIESIKEGDSDGRDVISENISNEVPIGDYIEGLEVASPLRYQGYGGEVVSFELQDINGIKVNMVATGFTGLVKLVVRFDQAFKDVVFGFHLKSISGLEVAGLSYPRPQESLVEVLAGDTMEVFWKINMSLVAGTYFFTFGVRSISDGKFIDRIVDGAIVKVTEKENSTAYGVFDISHQESSWIRKV